MAENKIALTLRELRDKKGVSQDIVSEACGMTRVTLARYETGARIPKAENVARLAAYYGVTSDHILGCDQEDPSQSESTPVLLTREERMLQMFRQMDEKEQDAFIKWLEKR